MKKLLFAVVSSLCAAICLMMLYFIVVAGANTDAYYRRFTSPRQRSLILGTSRAAQGIRPEVFNEQHSPDFDGPMYTFAFTNNTTPFGPAYFRAVQKKLDPTTRNGLYILEVSPMAISAPLGQDTGAAETDISLWPENETFVNTMYCVNSDPNLEYLLFYYSEPYYTLLVNRMVRRHTHLHNNGWLEVTVAMDHASYQNRLKSKIEQYSEFFETNAYSSLRKEWLERMISYLKAHGKVVLARIPVSREMQQLEEDYMPDFNQQMQELATSTRVHYHDLYTNYYGKFATTDGNHICRENGRDITRVLVEKILETEQGSTAGAL